MQTKKTTRLDVAKAEAEAFAKSAFDNSQNIKVRTALVTFNKEVASYDFVDNLDDFSKNVNSIPYNGASKNNSKTWYSIGGTNLQAGISATNQLLTDINEINKESNINTTKVVVVLTDGDPTWFTLDDGTNCDSGDGGVTDYRVPGSQAKNLSASDNKKCSKITSGYPSDYAKTAAMTLKGTLGNDATNLYSIIFNNDTTPDNKNEDTNRYYGEPKNQIIKKIYTKVFGEESTYYSAEDTTGLDAAFANILQSAIKYTVATDAVTTDIIPADFELTDESKAKLKETGVKITTSTLTDGSTQLTWAIGDVVAGQAYTLNFEIKAKDEYHGSMFTNDGAKMTFKPKTDNPAYGSDEKTLTVDDPYVPIPAWTEDDEYKTSGEKISENILANDNEINSKAIEKEGKTVAEASDQIVIDDNRAECSNQICTIETEYGTFIVNATTGEMTFTPNNNIPSDETDISFNYHIETTVTYTDGKTETVDSSDHTYGRKYSIVTVTLVPIQITAQKQWDDNDNEDGKRPTEIELQLYADSEVYSDNNGEVFVTLDEDNDWNKTLDQGFYRNTVDGDEISYSFKELTKLQNGYKYDSQDIEETEDGFIITVVNTYTREIITPEITTIEEDPVITLIKVDTSTEEKSVTSPDTGAISKNSNDGVKESTMVVATIVTITLASIAIIYARRRQRDTIIL